MTEADLTPDAESADEAQDADANDAEHAGSRRARRRRSRRREIVEWVLVIGGALIVALVIKALLLQAFYIPSASMEPTLKVGDRVIVNKLSYHLHDVNRGDIVVFRRPADHATSVQVKACDGRTITISRTSSLADEKIDDLIKRVVALPGETIDRRDDGHLYVNGQLLSEPYVKQTNGVSDQTPRFGFDAQCIVVPDHQVFVLGDNRQNSQASNYFGPIDESLIVGRAFVRVWPLGSFSTL
ncbi:MAG: signal peptidase I [Acidimicrobiales bacterium]